MVTRIPKLQNALLTVGAVLGALCLLAALAGLLFGIKPLMFRSGSMEPAIPTGALALSIPANAADIHVGDIVSTENSAGTRITHRVTAVTPAEGYAELTLKGDANDVVDGETYPITTVDRVFWSVPVLGYAVAWLTSPVALFLGGLLTAYLLYVAFGSGGRGKQDGALDLGSAGRRRLGGRRSLKKPRKDPHRRGVQLTVFVAVVFASAQIHSGDSAQAMFTDTAKASFTVKAETLPAPGVQCLNVSGGIKLSWSYDAYPVPPKFTVAWRKSGASSWAELSKLQSAQELTVSAYSLRQFSVLSAGSYTPVEFRVSAHSANWFSNYGVKGGMYYEPLSALGIPLGSPSLSCVQG